MVRLFFFLPLLVGGVLFGQQAPEKPKARSLVEWWKNSEFLETLELSQEQIAELTTKLDRYQVEYQVHWTKLRAGKKVVQKN